MAFVRMRTRVVPEKVRETITRLRKRKMPSAFSIYYLEMKKNTVSNIDQTIGWPKQMAIYCFILNPSVLEYRGKVTEIVPLSLPSWSRVPYDEVSLNGVVERHFLRHSEEEPEARPQDGKLNAHWLSLCL